MSYDENAQIVRATGNVVVVRGSYRLNAEEVVYDRNSGIVTARGDVRVIDAIGNEVFAGEVELDDELRDGAIDGFLLALEGGGRLAAAKGTRTGGISVLDRAVYSPCNVVGEGGCPKEPLWQIKAVSITHDPEAHRIRYKDARFELFGVPILWLPSLSHSDSADARASGLLIPSLRIDNNNGVSLRQPYFFALNDSSDLTIAPTVYTEVLPALSAEYRKLTSRGPFSVGGIVTYSDTETFTRNGNDYTLHDDIRGYFYGNGQFNFDENWRTTFGVRLTTDDTFLRRYDISRDTTLRNFARVERFGSEAYLNVEAWAFQGLALDDEQGTIPIALPIADFRYTPGQELAGGRVSVEASTATITRTDGMDSFRLSAGGQWQASTITPFGQKITATALLRSDTYRTNDSALAEIPSYAGEEGWESRFIPAAAIDMTWPLAGPAFGGTQLITPRVQISASPHGVNDGIPNEDSRAVDLETSNLFDISRFPGHDRWEGGPRVTYGVSYRLDRPRWLIEAEVGQSYSLDDQPSSLPEGTGFAERFSDLVGRNTLRIGRRFDIVHRYRLDKDSLKLRRNEIDLTLGGRRDYVTLGYLKLDRDIGLEDLADREEARAGGRLQMTRYWSVFGSLIVDLTNEAEDPLSLANGFDPIRHRVGFQYEDECFRFGLTWRRDYSEIQDFQRGNTFLFNVALKNIGG
nr:LPS assembly protein LptD [Pacificimonas flava]